MRALAVVLLLLLAGCHGEHNTRITPFPDACPNACYPCDGKGPVVFYEPPEGARSCAMIDPADVERDALCFSRFPSGTDVGWPRCFYGCDGEGDGTACVPPVD